MVGYIEICEINGLGQEERNLLFLTNKKVKEICGYIFCIPRMKLKVFWQDYIFFCLKQYNIKYEKDWVVNIKYFENKISIWRDYK